MYSSSWLGGNVRREGGGEGWCCEYNPKEEGRGASCMGSLYGRRRRWGLHVWGLCTKGRGDGGFMFGVYVPKDEEGGASCVGPMYRRPRRWGLHVCGPCTKGRGAGGFIFRVYVPKDDVATVSYTHHQPTRHPYIPYRVLRIT